MKYNILLSTLFILSSCVSAYTQQNVKNIALVELGMEQENVIEVMGEAPAKIEFSGNNKAFHYCNTEDGPDEYAVVIFSNGTVVAVENYNVTLADTGGAKGDCSLFLKSVDLDQPDFVKKIRYRK